MNTELLLFVVQYYSSLLFVTGKDKKNESFSANQTKSYRHFQFKIYSGEFICKILQWLIYIELRFTYSSRK